MNLVAITMTGYAATATFLFWYIPFITRNRTSWLWLPSRGVHFLFGTGMSATVVALVIQVIVPAAFVCWAAVATLKLLFLA
jgi:hypothetical protein